MADRVEVVGPNGERGSVDASELPLILAQKGRALTPQELAEERYGGTGAIGAAAIGALDTATAGGFTAAASQFGKAVGKQAETEEAIRGLKETNPISHALGSAAPLMLAPNAGGEELAAGLIKGEGAAAQFGRFALPHMIQGTAESAWMEGAQGVSEDVLDHDLSAESFYVHALRPESLYGGLLNVGAASAFKGLGKLTSRSARALGGKSAEVVGADAESVDSIIKAVQSAGGTTEEANAAIRSVQEMANQRVSLPAAERSLADEPARAYIKAQAKGNPAVERQLWRHYRDGAKVLDQIDKEFTDLGSQADKHMTSLVNDLTTLEDARLNLKHQSIIKSADETTISQAHDAATGWIRELRATLKPPELPPEPAAPESQFKKVIQEWRRQGVKRPADPAEAEAFDARAKAWADAAWHSETESHTREVQRLMQEREALVDPKLRELYGDPATRVGFSAKDWGKLDSLLNDVQAEVNRGRKVGGREGVARIYTALDDSRAIIGHMAKFGKLTSDSAKMLERYIYNNRLKPLLEDSNLWGSRLAALQADNNAAVTHSIQAIGDLKKRFFGSLDSVDGTPIYTPKGNTKSFLEGLANGEEAMGGQTYDEQMVRRVTESARARGAAMLKTMDLPPQVRGALERAQKSSTELERIMDIAKQTAADAREIKALKAREAAAGSHGLIGSVMTGVAGMMGGPIAGAAFGAGRLAYTVAKNPARTLEWIGQFRKAEVGVRKAFSKETSGFLKGEGVPVVKPLLTEAERKAAIQSIQDVQRYQSDSRYLAVTIKDLLGDMADAAPRVASSLAITIARGVIALAKRAPQPLPSRFTDKPGEVRYASGELEKYWRSKQIVERPDTVMQLMRSGQLHQEDLALMEEFLPRILAQRRASLEMDVQKARDKGELRSMTYQEQLSLSWMLGRPLDPTQNPSFVAAMQESAMNDPMNQAAIGKSAMGGGRPSKLENINLERYTTLEERLEA